MTPSTPSTQRSELKKSTTPATLAAIVAQDSHSADLILDAVVDQLQRQAYSLLGLTQKVSSECSSQGSCGIRLQSIATEQYHIITQDLGVGSTSCNIDTDAMSQLVEAQKNELNIDTDLLVVNRFGKRESEGAGFCSVFERALELGIPALTVVKAQWQSNWIDYGGEYVTTLPANEEAVLAWCHSVLWVNRSLDANTKAVV